MAWQQVQLEAEQTYIENEAARKTDIYKVQQIGLVDTDGGQDQFMLVTDLEEGFPDETSKQIVWQWARAMNIYDTSRPGGWFCHQVTVLDHYALKSVIVVVHHRRDV
jgi:hypothetical protein